MPQVMLSGRPCPKRINNPLLLILAMAALSEYAANGQELDSWKAQHLRSALGTIYTDYFSLSMNEVVLAIAPADERALG